MENWVREKLDRGFANDLWRQNFPLNSLLITHTITSDHDPNFLEPVAESCSRKEFQFRFENTWLNETNYEKKVSNYWKAMPPKHMLPKLLSLSSFMA